LKFNFPAYSKLSKTKNNLISPGGETKNELIIRSGLLAEKTNAGVHGIWWVGIGRKFDYKNWRSDGYNRFFVNVYGCELE
jgi:hypothetical protein